MSADSVGDRARRGDRTAASESAEGGPPLRGLEPGTTLLVAGPSLVGTEEVLLGSLGHGAAQGEPGIVIATRADAHAVSATYRRVAGPRAGLAGIVDCVAGADDRGECDGVPVHRVPSPADLTGIGIATAELLGECCGAGASGVRVGLDSLSTLALYSAFDRTCRFLHVLSGRIARANGVGLFGVTPGALDRRQYDQLVTLFDGVVEVREREGGREVRTRGLPGVDADWRPYAPAPR